MYRYVITNESHEVLRVDSNDDNVTPTDPGEVATMLPPTETQSGRTMNVWCSGRP